MSSAWFALAAASGFGAGVTAVTVGDLVSEEVRERADRVPYWLIEHAGERMSPDVRPAMTNEWTAELHAILDQRGADRLPLTRLVIGIRYGVGLLWAAGAVDCALRGDGCARPSLRPGVGVAVARGAAPAVRAGIFGVAFGVAVGTGSNVGTVAAVGWGLGGVLGALVLGVLVGARMLVPTALGVGLGAGISAHLGLTAASLSLAVGGVLALVLAGTVLAGAGADGWSPRGRGGHGPLG
jgi:hypothetical protein